MYTHLLEDPGMRFDLVALNMSLATKPRGKRRASAVPVAAGAPENRVSELLPDTVITHIVPGPSAKHKLIAAEAQLSMRAADKAYQRRAAKCGSTCQERSYALTTSI